MSEKRAKVSIIMPCHNGEKFIAAAIESVQSQTMGDWELVISNDGSTDSSLDIIEAYQAKDNRLKILSRDKALGPAKARNLAIERAEGSYIAFLDCDDIWKPTKLEEQISFMEENNLALSACYYDLIDDAGNLLNERAPKTTKLTHSGLLKDNDIGCVTAIYNADMIGKKYMRDYWTTQDFILWLDILRDDPKAELLHKNLAQYRLHSGNRSAQKMKMAQMRWKIYREIEELPLPKALYYFSHYAVNGVIKSRIKPQPQKPQHKL